MANTDHSVATLGGGCFWCLEAVFRRLKGVESVVSGYAGGQVDNPTYKQVCSGTTGHAEVVQIHYDPSVIEFRDLLAVFFVIHDPTTINRQGNDVGPQYRSVIFWHDEDQKATAEATIRELEAANTYGAPIVTEIAPMDTFYPAEDYHQEYYDANPGQPFCQVIIEPKLAKFRDRFSNLLRE